MNHDQNKNAAPLLITVILVLSISYAVLRYHVAGPVPWKDFPFFILNKGFSLAAFVLIACNFGFGPLRNLGVPLPDSWLVARKAVGMTGFLLVLIHALMSFLLFKPLLAGLSMLAGVLAFVVLWAYNLSFQTFLREDKVFISFITSRRFLLVAFILGGVHLLFMGYEGWMKPGGWHGGLPPISLVAFAVFAMAYVVNLFGRE
jgi:hypothetical protein